MYYCKFCDKTMNINSKMKHNYSKSHLYLVKYIIKEEIYLNIDLENVGKIIFDCVNRCKYEFNEFCIKVKCETDDKSTSQKETYYKYPKHGYIVNGIIEKDKESKEILQRITKKICNKIHSVFDRNDVVKNLSIKLIADYDKMSLYHRLFQPRRVLESQLIIQIKKTKEKLIEDLLIFCYQDMNYTNQNRVCFQTHCNDCRNPFHFACR